MATENEKCECEEPGPFNCGVPGVLAKIEGGILESTIERCDACERFATDDAAAAELVRLEVLRVIESPPAQDASKEYLGDSVYATFDGFYLTLTTENGDPNDPSNRIMLEPAVQVALVRYIERIVKGEP